MDEISSEVVVETATTATISSVQQSTENIGTKEANNDGAAVLLGSVELEEEEEEEAKIQKTPVSATQEEHHHKQEDEIPMIDEAEPKEEKDDDKEQLQEESEDAIINQNGVHDNKSYDSDPVETKTGLEEENPQDAPQTTETTEESTTLMMDAAAELQAQDLVQKCFEGSFEKALEVCIQQKGEPETKDISDVSSPTKETTQVSPTSVVGGASLFDDICHPKNETAASSEMTTLKSYCKGENKKTTTKELTPEEIDAEKQAQELVQKSFQATIEKALLETNVQKGEPTAKLPVVPPPVVISADPMTTPPPPSFDEIQSKEGAGNDEQVVVASTALDVSVELASDDTFELEDVIDTKPEMPAEQKIAYVSAGKAASDDIQEQEEMEELERSDDGATGTVNNGTKDQESKEEIEHEASAGEEMVVEKEAKELTAEEMEAEKQEKQAQELVQKSFQATIEKALETNIQGGERKEVEKLKTSDVATETMNTGMPKQESNRKNDDERNNLENSDEEKKAKDLTPKEIESEKQAQELVQKCFQATIDKALENNIQRGASTTTSDEMQPSPSNESQGEDIVMVEEILPSLVRETSVTEESASNNIEEQEDKEPENKSAPEQLARLQDIEAENKGEELVENSFQRSVDVTESDAKAATKPTMTKLDSPPVATHKRTWKMWKDFVLLGIIILSALVFLSSPAPSNNQNANTLDLALENAAPLSETKMGKGSLLPEKDATATKFGTNDPPSGKKRNIFVRMLQGIKKRKKKNSQAV